jgi:hypothetical protein
MGAKFPYHSTFEGHAAQGNLERPDYWHHGHNATVIMPRTNFIRSNLLDFSSAKVWKDLDRVLSSITTLQRTLIHLNSLCLYDIPAQVHTAIRSSMPLMEQRGILIFKSNDDVFPERDLWTDREIST